MRIQRWDLWILEGNEEENFFLRVDLVVGWKFWHSILFIIDSKLGRTFLLFFPEAVLREWKSWIFGLCWGGNILGLNFTWAFKLQRICYLGWIWKGEVEMLDSVRCLLSCTSGVGVQCNNGENQAHVYLNVYDLTPANKYLYWFGLGIFHSGIEGTCFFFITYMSSLFSCCSLSYKIGACFFPEKNWLVLHIHLIFCIFLKFCEIIEWSSIT